MRTLILSTTLCLGLVSAAAPLTLNSVPNGPLTIYLSPTGVDSADGLTPNTPIKTLAEAQQVILVLNPDTDVEIRIKQGVYLAPQTDWSTYIPGHTISFMPVDYQYGMNGTQLAGRPIFRSPGGADWWMYVSPSPPPADGTLGLRFYYLQVELYNNGLMLRGRYATDVNGIRQPTTGAGGNTVYGMSFLKLGTKWSGMSSYGVAAVDLINSSDNLVRVNHFRQLENLGPGDWSHIHAVYLAHGSSNNRIINNELRTISGAGVNIRNQSYGNEVTGNTFDHTGVHGHLSDWFCDGTCVTGASVQECTSWGTWFHDNTIGLGYTGAVIPNVVLTPPGNTYTGPTPCPTFLEGERVYGNSV